uniref:Transmembrane protein 33 n=1 Tax=Panagrolaimus sp. JU765 TaxID=591449 RepID=A0AC34Q6L9_9BILA
MVEIREETASHPENSGGGDASNATNTPGPRVSVVDYMKNNAMDTIIFSFRMLTIIFAIQYILPSTDASHSKSVYSKAFIAAGVSYAFRLYQRVGGMFSMQNLNAMLLQTIFMEDSTHYLLYCFTFPMSTPVTMALIPIVALSFYNAIGYVHKLAQETGTGVVFAQKLNDFRAQQSNNILSLVACAEIFNFPVFFALIFTGRCNIFFPFLYFRFLTFRYSSRRNPHTRLVFASLKQNLLQVTNHQSCPAIVRTGILKAINLVEKVAPPVV